VFSTANLDIIGTFSDSYFFLSNFYLHEIKVKSITYPSVEHAFQASKSLLIKDKFEIAAVDSPRLARILGRRVSLRPDWETVKSGVMLFLLREKFSNEILQKHLIKTGKAELIEGNHWGDCYWGICNGVGKNMLGKLLMQVRSEVAKPNKSWGNMDLEERRVIVGDFINQAVKHRDTKQGVGFLGK